jgi:hypothetical protein
VCVFARVVIIIVDVGLPTTRTLLAQLILSPTTRRYNSISDVIDEQGKNRILNVILLFVIVMFGVCFDRSYTRVARGVPIARSYGVALQIGDSSCCVTIVWIAVFIRAGLRIFGRRLAVWPNENGQKYKSYRLSSTTAAHR